MWKLFPDTSMDIYGHQLDSIGSTGSFCSSTSSEATPARHSAGYVWGEVIKNHQALYFEDL